MHTDEQAVPPTAERQLTLANLTGRGTLATTILGSGMVFLDGTVANVATRQIGREFDVAFDALQWVILGYTLALASLILLGGSLGDRYGRKRMYLAGMVWFAVASLLCAIAPSVQVLIAARVLQGIGGALLTPGSLAIIQSSFTPTDAPRAVGLWSGMSAISTAIGPLVGGYLVQHVSWRWAFAINLPLGVLAFALGVRFVPESRQPRALCAPIDNVGTVLIAISLGLLTYGPTLAGTSGWDGTSSAITVAGAAVMAAFVAYERRHVNPLVPPSLFANRTFNGANLMTFATYGALAVVSFLLSLHLQVSAGFGAFKAGLATLPIVLGLLILSPIAGAATARFGPRWLMTLGPLIAALGMLLTLRIDPQHHDYLTDVLPSVVVFALGLGTFVAPLTSTVMGAAPVGLVGIASGVNNAVSRAAGLLAIAVIPPIAGLVGTRYQDPALMTHGYRVAILISVGVLVAGALTVPFTVGRQTPRASRIRGSAWPGRGFETRER